MSRAILGCRLALHWVPVIILVGAFGSWPYGYRGYRSAFALRKPIGFGDPVEEQGSR